MTLPSAKTDQSIIQTYVYHTHWRWSLWLTAPLSVHAVHALWHTCAIHAPKPVSRVPQTGDYTSFCACSSCSLTLAIHAPKPVSSLCQTVDDTSFCACSSCSLTLAIQHAQPNVCILCVSKSFTLHSLPWWFWACRQQAVTIQTFQPPTPQSAL